jgi:beta-lactamase class A
MTAPPRTATLRVVLLAIGGAVAGSVTMPARQDAKPAALGQVLERRLDAITTALDGVLGYAIVDLTSGQRIEHLPDEVFPTASTIKLAILYELFKQADEGALDLDQIRPLDRRHVVAGTGVLRELTAPSMALRDYAALMIVVSDNTATNVLIETLGMEKVTTRMRALGLPQTRLRRRMIDLAAARRGDENVSTPAEIARLLQILYRGDGLSKASRDALIAILKKDKSTPMRQGIPADVEVANKPGSLEGVAVDAGIVFLKDRPYIFVAMATFLESDAIGDAAITTASRAAFDYFSRLAHASDYGRAIK